MCLGKRKGGLKFSDCIGHVAIGVIKHFWSQCTLSCTQNTHSHAASQGRSYQIPLSVTVTGNVSEPSEKLTYALQWCQSEIPGTSSGPRVQLSFLGCQMCSTTGWGQPFVALKHCWLSSLLSDVSRHPHPKSLPSHCCSTTVAVHGIYPASNALPNICRIFLALFSKQ